MRRSGLKAAGGVGLAALGFALGQVPARGSFSVLIPMCLLFLAPFVDVRRPFRLLHLDLLVLVSFLASLWFFNHGHIHASVPLVYPPLLYLLVRMLLAAFRPRRADEAQGARLHVPATWMVVAIVFLVGFRVGLNVSNGDVFDVGYVSVVGAHHLVHGEPLYGSCPQDSEHCDTYGPVVAYAYAPAELAFPWNGKVGPPGQPIWFDDLPAAHAAAIVFDLLALAAIWLLGWRIRGPTLGLMLAYAWVTFPFTMYASNVSSNDALVALLIIVSLLVVRRPVWSGASAALVGLTKFAPLALAPALATYDDGERTLRPRRLVPFAGGFLVVAVLALLPVLTRGQLRLFYERTVGYQSHRGDPFSVWVLWNIPDGAQLVVQLAAVALAVAVAFVPRRRDIRVLAAVCAATLIALQLAISHWFYLYVVWFFPLAILVLLEPLAPATPPRPMPGEPDVAEPRSGVGALPATSARGV